MFSALKWLVGLAAILVCWDAFIEKSYTYNYRLTVSVRDHGVLRTASNVVSVKEAATLDHNAWRPHFCGEATAVPLSNGQSVLALLEGLPYPAVSGQYPWRATPTWMVLNRLGLPTQWSYEDDSGIRALHDRRDTITLLSHEMPEFVTFANSADPTTIMRVDPEHPEVTLGPGVRFERVTLQITDENVTTGGVRKILPWLSTWREYLDGSDSGYAVHGYQSWKFTSCGWFARLQIINRY